MHWSDSWNAVNLVGHGIYKDIMVYRAPVAATPNPNAPRVRSDFTVSGGWRAGGYLGLVDVGSQARVIAFGIEGQTLLSPSLQIEGRAGLYDWDGASSAAFTWQAGTSHPPT